jgi:hypothetical protein
MLIDATEFPLVQLRLKGSDIDPEISPFDVFEALLARKEAFVFINDEGLGEKDEHKHSQEKKKQASLWMKRHKSELRSFVKALICVEPDTAKRLAAKAFAPMYEKFWGYPMLMVATEEQALDLARKLLKGKQAGGES